MLVQSSLCDINVHVEDPADVNASCLLELLSSMDLQQHLTTAIHRAGGNFDLVIIIIFIFIHSEFAHAQALASYIPVVTEF